MFKKDLGLLLLILVVGAAVALINPRFLSPINLSNTANLVALLGVFFVDLIGNVGVHWSLALLAVIAIGMLMGATHGFLVTRMKLQPFVVTLCSLLIYRSVARYYTEDATAGFAFGQSFPTLEWLTSGRTHGVPHSLIAFVLIALVL